MAEQTSDTIETISLLKVDDKGWNRELFITNKEDSICAYCKNVCCDAVELDCEHTDAEIFPYCAVCLNQLISDKEGKCPINLHSDPVIHAVRSLRRQILQYTVLCPSSIKFKHKTDNASQNNDEYKCEWSGSLNDLISKHIIDCTGNNNPLFVLQSKLKDSENKNNFLNIIVNEQKQKIIELKKQNDELLVRNKNLETLLTEKNKIIEQYEKEASVENKQDENKNDVDSDSEYWIKCGKGMTINDCMVEYKGNYGYCTVYSRVMVDNGIHEWKIKILEQSSGCSMYIGIASTMDHCNLLFCGKGVNYDRYNVGYSGYDAIKINYDNNGKEYGEKYSKGDVITVCLDLNEKCISFKKNDKDFGVAFDNICVTEYRLAVSMYAWVGDNASISMISDVDK